jgi:hypothetical protein
VNGIRHSLVAVAALLGAAGMCGAASAATIAVRGDSVIVTGLAAGRATVRVTRPDARTKAPVAIGEFAGAVRGSLPFTVNTTVPNALFLPTGDCWQAGALHLPGGVGLTPDIRPGDTVSVVGGPRVTMPDVLRPSTQRGPIAGCGSRSAFGENAVTKAPATVTNRNLVVAGVAQPLATGVSVSASDGRRATPPVVVVPGAGGRWTATIPAQRIARLAKGRLTVSAVFAVPDVVTGAAAHIAGTPATVDKSAAALVSKSRSR